MIAKPKLESRNRKHYAAIRKQVFVPFGDQLPLLWNEVHAWLASRDMTPAGPPFIRYITTDMSKGLDIEVGFPVACNLASDNRISTGAFPAGIYATFIYSGPYENEGIVKATAFLLDWGKQNSLAWQTSILGETEIWESRVEFYLTDPEQEPDPKKWQTELAILTTKKFL
jgi:effector-binding domain-containing protein